MSWSSWTVLWQCIMYFPWCGPNFAMTRTVSPSPTYTVSFRPTSNGKGG